MGFSDQRAKLVHRRLDDDYRYYARHTLKIRTKEGKLSPFIFNRAQEHLDKELDKQLASLGRVRAVIVKGRQEGCSTYIGGRFYHKATRKKEKNVFILSHEGETTKKLFKMVETFHDEAPAPVKPKAEIANRKEYEFKEIHSSYIVGTAGNENVGRGGTVQLFHGSEAAFWEKTDGLETGILQSVADIDDTEIILESTANGMGNMFYGKCMDALEGKGDYILIFIPWYWMPEYSREVPADGVYELLEEYDEELYKKLYELTNAQIYWRRAKIIEFGDGEKGSWKFKQEYPAFVQEAFQTSGNMLIEAESIMKARKSTIRDPDAPLIMGVDPARNRDRTVFSYRRGREFLRPEIFKFDNVDNVQMEITGMIAQRIERLRPQKVFIDVGHGYGVIDRLKELGYSREIQGVQFGSQALEPEVYLNKRAEMWCLMRDWFHGEDGEVSITDEDIIQRDLMCMPEEKVTSSGKTKLMDKDTIRKTLKMSPDIGDAMALTFAYPVKRDGLYSRHGSIRKKNKAQSSLVSVQRKRGYNKNSEMQNMFWRK